MEEDGGPYLLGRGSASTPMADGTTRAYSASGSGNGNGEIADNADLSVGGIDFTSIKDLEIEIPG